MIESILAEVKTFGGTVEVSGVNLVVNSDNPLSESVCGKIREHKGKILEFLSKGSGDPGGVVSPGARPAEPLKPWEGIPLADDEPLFPEEQTEPAPIHQEPEKNLALDPQGEALDGGQGVTIPPETAPTLTEHQDTARWVCSQLSEGDADRRELESLIEVAGRGDDDLTRLGIRTVEVYGRRLDQTYRAAIWGGRTWKELTEDRRRGNG